MRESIPRVTIPLRDHDRAFDFFGLNSANARLWGSNKRGNVLPRARGNWQMPDPRDKFHLQI